MARIGLFADSVAAAAYRGGRAGLDKLLNHCAADQSFAFTGNKKLSRGEGEALCNPRLNLVGYRQPLETVTCPRCKQLAEKIFGYII